MKQFTDTETLQRLSEQNLTSVRYEQCNRTSDKMPS